MFKYGARRNWWQRIEDAMQALLCRWYGCYRPYTFGACMHCGKERRGG